MPRIDPHSYTDPSQGSMSHLFLDWQVDFDSHKLSGIARLDFAKAVQGPLDLDTRDLVIESVCDAQGKPLEWEIAEPEGFMGAKMTIQRPQPIDKIEIQYSTSPNASALQWLDPQHTAGGKSPFLFSQCQPIHARSMAPLQDSPRVRFSYQAKVHVAQGLSAVMSAAPGEESTDDQGMSCFEFNMPQPIPAYLLALAVGHLAARDLSPRARLYAEPATLEESAWEFAEVEQIIVAAEKVFGPYLWERFDFIVMPPAFPYGGMENPRLTFLTPTLITGDRSLVTVLAHEAAHSWTGNLVTNATMGDFWLNEGFTVWAERRILEALKDKEAVALAATIGRHDLEQEIERFGPDSPFTALENQLDGIDPDEIYSSIPYEKGFLFVTLMEQTLGREAFDDLVQRYIKHFQFQSITTSEFEAFMEAEKPGLLAKIDAEKWLRGKGIPANAPTFNSKRLEHLDMLLAGWNKGQKPDTAELESWSFAERQVFLQKLARPMSLEDCRWLDENLKLSTSGNAELRCEWIVIALVSGYPEAVEQAKAFVMKIGRMKFLKPIYNALKGVDLKRAQAIFKEGADRYHPIARAGLEALLELN